MKNFWTYGVIAVFLLFAVLMSCFALYASRNDPEQKRKDHLAAILNQRKKKEKMANTALLPILPEVTVTQDEVVLFLPSSINEVDKGTIAFCRANGNKVDIKIPLEPRASGRQGVPLSVIPAGAWKMQLDWEANGKGYFFEKTITIR
jgi:hypothetical protein